MFDLQPIGIAGQAIKPDAEGMSSELGERTSGEAPEGMGIISLQVELLGQLAVDGLDALADLMTTLLSQRNLAVLVGGTFPSGGAMRCSLGAGLRSMIKLDDRHGQTINNALSLICARQQGKDRLSQHRECIRQVPTTTITRLPYV